MSLGLTHASTYEEVAAAIINESRRRGHSPDETIAELSTGIQESGLRMVWSPNGKWYGYFQQDASYPHRGDPNGNVLGFFDRLDAKRRHPGASEDPFKNIFWLQQRPSDPSAEKAYERGRKAYYDEIRRHVACTNHGHANATELFNRFTGGQVKSVWRGDPVWLPEVLRAEGLTCEIYPGAFNRGHGDFGEIWGVMCHHTGSNPPSNNPGYIANHPQLGLASQLHLSRSGVYTLCGVGIAWHAGNGSYPGIPTNQANRYTIGIEAENNGTEGWSHAQYSAYVKGVAAILRRLGHDSSRVIGHKEWAGASQGKWDPGGIDMNRFRADVQRQIDSKGGDDLTPEQDKMLREIHACLFNQIASQSIYRNPGEQKPWQLHELIKNMDGMSHEERVEQLARQGDPDSIMRIVRLAQGEGAVKEQWAIERAKRALRTIPTEILEAWEASQ